MLLLDALALAPAVLKLRVVGYETIGHLGYMNQFLAHAKEKGLESRVQCIGAVPTREELLVRARQCDLGLALMPKQSDDINMQFMAGASNKPFDYLACGLALVVSKISDWQRMFVDSGYGLACDPEDPQSIADVLSWYAAHLPEMRAMGEKGRRHLEADWNYESAFQPVIDRLNAEVS
jgi:glycosyltransferase involved in cell wall biosynthesis